MFSTALSDKKKASNAKWDKENMTTLGCRVKKDDADAFKKYCVGQNKTSNTVLKEYVDWCIGATDTSAKILVTYTSSLFGDTSQVELACDETETQYLVRCPECKEEIAISKTVEKAATCKCGLSCTLVPR